MIDDAGALADQAFAHSMKRLQVEPLGSLGRDKLHCRALDRLSGHGDVVSSCSDMACSSSLASLASINR